MSIPPITARDFALRHHLKVIRDTILPAQMQAAILRQCPGILISELEDALDSYRFAEVLAPQIPLNERKAGFERVARSAQDVLDAIDQLGTFDRSSLHERVRFGRKKGLNSTRHALRRIADAAQAEAAKIDPAPGRPLTRKAYIVRDVARELRRNGFEVDASSKGPLVFIVSELLSLVDEPPQDIRSLVRNTLAKIDFETMDFCQDKAP